MPDQIVQPGLWVIELAGVNMAEIRRHEHIHAVVGRWCDRTRDHKAGPKPWSARHGMTTDGVPLLLVSALTQCAAHRLVEHAVEGSSVRFGRQSGIVARTPWLRRELNWRQISDKSSSTRAWRVEFRTPTSFSKHSGRFTPLPDPVAVWRSLSNRWNTLKPDEVSLIDTDPRQATRIWVSDFAAHNEVLELHLGEDGPTTVSGVVGEFQYRGETDAAASDFTKLLRFAEFAGVGRYTTHGLGHVAVTWPQVPR